MGYENLVYSNRSQTRIDIGVSYLGGVSHSTKLMHSRDILNIATYGVYLAPADLSGYNVCPNSFACKEHCLFGSGQNMMSILSGKNGMTNTRIKKTRLFMENREYFMQWLIAEIRLRSLEVEIDGYKFSVRLNLTSDISIIDFVYQGKNILEIFPDVIFYDYTKVFNNLRYSNEYLNYDLTYSYNGYNWGLCEKSLRGGNRVAVVFEGKKLPKTFHGYRVINGDLYDARYMDDKNVVVGLKFKMIANNVKHGKYIVPKTPFVVTPDNEFCVW